MECRRRRWLVCPEVWGGLGEAVFVGGSEVSQMGTQPGTQSWTVENCTVLDWTALYCPAVLHWFAGLLVSTKVRNCHALCKLQYCSTVLNSSPLHWGPGCVPIWETSEPPTNKAPPNPPKTSGQNCLLLLPHSILTCYISCPLINCRYFCGAVYIT